MIHDKRSVVGPGERTEDALIITIHDELEKARKINRDECSIETLHHLYASFSTIKALCRFGKQQLYSMTVRGANHIRLTEQELATLEADVRQQLSEKNNEELLKFWDKGEKQ